MRKKFIKQKIILYDITYMQRNIESFYLPLKSTINASLSSQLIELKASTAFGHLLRFSKN